MLPHRIRIFEMPHKTTNAAELDETCSKTDRQLSPAASQNHEMLWCIQVCRECTWLPRYLHVIQFRKTSIHKAHKCRNSMHLYGTIFRCFHAIVKDV